MHDAAFLPQVVSAASAAGNPRLAGLATATEHAAAEAWLAMLGECTCTARRTLPDRLATLSAAVAEHADTADLPRAEAAQRWICESLAEGDGGEFAAAFAGYDAALAGVLVGARVTMEVAG